MKDRLDEYRNAMNSSVFKENQFTAEHKQQILAKLHKSPQPKKKSDWMPRAMSVAFIAFLLFVGGYFMKEQLGIPTGHIAEPSTERTIPQSGNIGLPVEVEEEEQVLESPYQEIRDYFNRYELPEEGRLDSSEAVNGVSYENGYTFERDKKYMIGRAHYEGIGPKEPTEGQEVGVIMGWIAGAAAIQHPEYPTAYITLGALNPPLASLKQAKELNDFEPLEEWITEVENLLKRVQSAEAEAEKKELYEESYEMLQKMYSIIIGRYDQEAEDTPTSLEEMTSEDKLKIKEERFQVLISESESIIPYIASAKREWLDSPRANGTFEMEQDVQMSVAEATISYVNFFETEIQELGMKEEFDELQLLAFALWRDWLPEEEFKIKAQQFGEKLLEIEAKL